ncbi:MAG: hypothetical protein ACYSWS_08335 [Planctomycetota bacterium]
MLRNKKAKGVLCNDSFTRLKIKNPSYREYATDLLPVPDSKSCFTKDHEYVRHGTVGLMA